MEQLTGIQQYHDIVERYRRPGCLTNDYLQTRAGALIADGLLSADCHEQNAYLLERKDVCWRLYYYLNDLTVATPINTPDGRPAVVEILYRGEEHFPNDEVAFLERMGFERNLVRDQYAAVYKDLTTTIGKTGDVVVRLAGELDEVAWACDLFNEVFDPYSGDFIPEADLPQLLHNGQIIVALDQQGTKLGALHQTVERNVAWISHVAVLPAARGRHVGKSLLDAFIEGNHTSDKSRYMLWVQQQNAPAVAMYRNRGFRYLNKSTLSLIKNNQNNTD